MKQSDFKAINWFCNEYNLKPQLSIPPSQIHFTNRRTLKEETYHLDRITLEYKAFKKEESKRKAREKKNEKI